MFLFFSEKKKKIVSLKGLAPQPSPDDQRLMYAAVMLPTVENDETAEETQINAETIARCLERLQNSAIWNDEYWILQKRPLSNVAVHPILNFSLDFLKLLIEVMSNMRKNPDKIY